MLCDSSCGPWRAETRKGREWRAAVGGGGEGTSCFMGTEFQFYKMRASWSCWWRWSPNEVSVLDATVHLELTEQVKFILHVFYHNKKREKPE